jgi:hypothetical protein
MGAVQLPFFIFALSPLNRSKRRGREYGEKARTLKVLKKFTMLFFENIACRVRQLYIARRCRLNFVH